MRMLEGPPPPPFSFTKATLLPGSLLVLTAMVEILVPQRFRDSYELIVVGLVVLLALRLFFLEHETREDRKVPGVLRKLSEMMDDKVRLAKEELRKEIADVRATAEKALAVAERRLPPANPMDPPWEE